MCNITLEDLYKKAVKEKYEEVKNGDDFFFLNAPTRGKLNKLCWEKFTNKEMHSNDLTVFNSLLGLSFDINSKNKFRQETNPFRPVEKFFKGETDPDKIEVVDMAAILVDFQPRPFNKFRKEIDPEDLKLIEELRDTNFSKGGAFSDNLIDEVETEKLTDLKIEEQEQIQSHESETIQSPKSESVPMPIVSVTSVVTKDKPKPEIIRDNKLLIAITAFAVCLGLVIYFAFFNKQCMQWSEDHYEIVDCSSEIGGNFNEIIRLDKELLDFKKIKACDTTTCFLTNGDPIVWYCKTANGIDFFNDNGNGLHPESKKALRPMTGYMVGKYLKGKTCE
ncbi:hypothetical protein OD917_01740 [Flavobacterium sp. SH_e]|uniref:hypothetical protein n=1 Tax=Flavobacterium TaxID=237 RepID=UPI0021E49A48|nr:hypothetical protein [Flavobacterium sp. SH_e]MCV2483629.1 hypothetical protein [Flavobacterium sp. SH_e]